jgi:hypothetical protein
MGQFQGGEIGYLKCSACFVRAKEVAVIQMLVPPKMATADLCLIKDKLGFFDAVSSPCQTVLQKQVRMLPVNTINSVAYDPNPMIGEKFGVTVTVAITPKLIARSFSTHTINLTHIIE